MLNRKARCAVIGAANIDIGGFPGRPLVPRDSNPGRITLSSGGVGRNIACNLAKLGLSVELVTALGGDAFGELLRRDCRAAGVGLNLALDCPDAASSAYLFIADSNGDMRLAVNDMAICARLTPEALAPRLDALNAMDAVVLDANLPAEAVAWLAENVRAPLLADAVSAAKAARLKGALPRLRALKPNALEAEALTGIPAQDPEGAKAAARRLVEAGVQRVFITLGADGTLAADARQALHLPNPPVRLVNATGAGDAFTAALVWGETRGLDLRKSALAALSAAALAVESEATVSPKLSERALLARIDDPGADNAIQ